MAEPSNDFKRRTGYFHAISRTNTMNTQAWYESKYKSAHSVRAADVWADDIPYCGDEAAADAFVAANPSIARKYTQYSLTEVPGSNGQAWYIDDGGQFMRPWISPTDVPHPTTNEPSYGFEAKLYDSSNNQIPPTVGVWLVDYYAGIVRFQEGYTPSDQGWGIPKITCYVYIGQTMSGGAVGNLDNVVMAEVNWIALTPDAPQSTVVLMVVDNNGNIVTTGGG